MAEAQKHSPTPWTRCGYEVEDKDGLLVLDYCDPVDADLIVAAVNAWNDPAALRARAEEVEKESK